MSFVSKRYLSIVKCLLTLAPGLVLTPLAVLADSLDEPTSFEIDAQALDTALIEFSEQADIQLVVRGELVTGLESDGLRGEFTPRTALAALLDDTGLSYTAIGEDSVAVATDQGGDSDSKNLSPAPILMAQNTMSQATENGRNDKSTPSIVTGRVTDARTGASLKGAKVTIEETGQWVSTNDLGEFRIVDESTTTTTVSVSYLGYAKQSAQVTKQNGTVVRNFSMRGGNSMEEIVVVGQRSARALSLNQERTAPNSTTVVSSDLLGGFNGSTISEALRRAPGVAFVPDPTTGDGANIIIRGLEPDLNQVTLNGLRIADGTGIGRSPDISQILTESIDSVTINKTLLPSHDSNGAGGLVEIETKSPLDRPRRYLSFAAEHAGLDNELERDVLTSGVVSGRFGADQSLGLSLSVQHRDRDVQNVLFDVASSIAGFGQYLPQGDSAVFALNPTRSFPFEPGVSELYPTSSLLSEQSARTETSTITGGIQKLIGDHTDLRLDYAYSKTESDSFGASMSIGSAGTYVPLPIAELNGETRFAYTVEDVIFPGVAFSMFRVADVALDTQERSKNLSFRGETDVGSWEIKYGLGYVDAVDRTPFGGTLLAGAFSSFTVDPALLSDRVRNNTTNGRIRSVFDPLLPGEGGVLRLPGLNQAGFDFYNDVSNLPLGFASDFSGQSGKNDRRSGKLSVRRNMQDSWLQYVELGGYYERSKSASTSPVGQSTFVGSFAPPYFGSVPLDVLGLRLGNGLFADVGAPGNFEMFDRASVVDFFVNSGELVDQGLLLNFGDPTTVAGPRDQLGNREKETAGYFQARADIGRLEIVGGVRIRNVDVDTAFFATPTFIDEAGIPDPTYVERFGQVLTASASGTETLPRLAANFRFSENMIFRGSFHRTVAQPAILNQVSAATVSLNLDRTSNTFNRPTLSVSVGNPNLKPAVTDNFDASWEWYSSELGVLKASVFYKEISNSFTGNRDTSDLRSLPAGVTLPDTPDFNNLPDDILIFVNTTLNEDDKSKIWGAELAIERQFTFLPGFWSGFGFYGNYTYTDSSRTETFDYFDFDLGESLTVDILGLPFEGSPEHSGTVALTYSDFGVDASLTYSAQERRLINRLPFGLNAYNEPVETLDFRLEYQTAIGNADVRLYVEGDNLLQNTTDPYLETTLGGFDGVPRYFTGATFFGGRSFSIGVRTSFN